MQQKLDADNFLQQVSNKEHIDAGSKKSHNLLGMPLNHFLFTLEHGGIYKIHLYFKI